MKLLRIIVALLAGTMLSAPFATGTAEAAGVVGPEFVGCGLAGDAECRIELSTGITMAIAALVGQRPQGDGQ